MEHFVYECVGIFSISVGFFFFQLYMYVFKESKCVMSLVIKKGSSSHPQQSLNFPFLRASHLILRASHLKLFYLIYLMITYISLNNMLYELLLDFSIIRVICQLPTLQGEGSAFLFNPKLHPTHPRLLSHTHVLLVCHFPDIILLEQYSLFVLL